MKQKIESNSRTKFPVHENRPTFEDSFDFELRETVETFFSNENIWDASRHRYKSLENSFCHWPSFVRSVRLRCSIFLPKTITRCQVIAFDNRQKRNIPITKKRIRKIAKNSSVSLELNVKYFFGFPVFLQARNLFCFSKDFLSRKLEYRNQRRNVYRGDKKRSLIVFQ